MTVSIVDSQASIISDRADKRVGWDEKRTPWGSIWIGIYMQFIIGVQMSIYYMSTWPYLNNLDSSADFHFVGWIVAAGSIGCSIANPIFGWWNQKTMSVTVPVCFGLLVSCLGQIMYALLPICPISQKWSMIVSRLIIGFGTGSISVLRAYTAMASVPEDKLKAIAYSTAGWVLGLSFGPAVQSLFTPFGDGWTVFVDYRFDLYTTPPYFMVVVNLVSCVVMSTFFKETYSGIIDQDEQEANHVFLPKFDLPAALTCIWLWICSCAVSTNIEVMSTPLSTILFRWDDSTSILWNGILTSVTSLVSVCVNFIIGSTRIGKIDKRKQILGGLFLFLAYHLCNYPWPFYPGPLQYIPNGTTTAEVGGCDPKFTWCEHTVAVPLPIYIITFVLFFGIGFPFIGSPSASLYTEILGPRPQGNMQGLYSFGGSMAQFVAPVMATFLFQHTGYQLVILSQIAILSIGFFLLCTFYKRLVPLELKTAESASFNGSI